MMVEMVFALTVPQITKLFVQNSYTGLRENSHSGRCCYFTLTILLALCIYQLGVDGFFCGTADIVHSPHLCHLILGLEFLGDALCCGHLLGP